MNKNKKYVFVIVVFLLTMIIPSSAIDVRIVPGDDGIHQCTIEHKEGYTYPEIISEVDCTILYGGKWSLISGIPEFPTIALPVIAVIGLIFLFQRRKVGSN